MTKTIQYTGEITITIPDDKLKEILPGFREVMDSGADEDSLFIHIAHNVVYCGAHSWVEGIGDADVDYSIEDYDKPDLEVMD